MIEINEDEILLEKYFPYKNMSIDSRNMSLFLISKSKELEGSINSGNKFKSYDIVSMNLKRENETILFNGFASNGEENKFLEGKINKLNNGFVLNTSVYRLYEYLDDDDRDYCYSELFESKSDGLIRTTIYSDGSMYKDKLENIIDSDIDMYMEDKARILRKK